MTATPSIIIIIKSLLLLYIPDEKKTVIEWVYCRMGNYSDVKTLANLAIDSFSLKFQVANLLRH